MGFNSAFKGLMWRWLRSIGWTILTGEQKPVTVPLRPPQIFTRTAPTTNPDLHGQAAATTTIWAFRYELRMKDTRLVEPVYRLRGTIGCHRTLAGITSLVVNEWNTGVKHCWNDTDGGKLKYSEKGLQQWHFVHNMCNSDTLSITCVTVTLCP